MNFPLRVALTVSTLSILLTLLFAIFDLPIGPVLRLPLGLMSILSVGFAWSLLAMKKAGLLEHATLGVILAICLPTIGTYIAVKGGVKYSENLVISVISILYFAALPVVILRFRRNAISKQ